MGSQGTTAVPRHAAIEGSGIVLDRIWAPWRAQYIHEGASTSKPSGRCFLCHGAEHTEDRENLLVLRGAHSIVMLNRYPYNNGHLLVAPRVHRGTLGELEGPDLLEPIQVVRKMTAILDRMLRPQGYNIGLNQGKAAGAGLPGHLHWHVVPRWDGDTNFMPILGHAKVIIESLYDFYDRLVEELGREAGSSG
jgi:ATP adenylyltransferase